MSPADLSLAAFAACNALRLVAYLPQMVALWRDPRAAPAFSYASWALFTAANASTAVYATVVLADVVLAALHLASAACCGVLIGLARWRRQRLAGAALRSALG